MRDNVLPANSGEGFNQAERPRDDMSHQLMIRQGRKYRAATNDEIAETAASYIANRLIGTDALTSPRVTREYLMAALAGRSYEVFCCLFLDNRNRVIRLDEVFRGTIDGASVFPREIVKLALANNAAAVIFAHNHPSGNPEPSQADEMITARLRDALALVDIRTLDHIVVAADKTVSFAERGLL
jgi:DNA repair protein RadC